MLSKKLKVNSKEIAAIARLKSAWENYGRLKPISSGLNNSTVSFSSENSKFNKS